MSWIQPYLLPEYPVVPAWRSIALAIKRLSIRGWTTCVAVVTLMGLPSCRQGKEQALPPSAPEVRITMDEYRFEYDQGVSQGRVTFRAANKGSVLHRVVLFRVPNDFPPIGVQLQSPKRRPIVPLASVPPQLPGRAGSFAVDLRPGRYAIICTMIDPDNQQTHALKGMSSEFRVRQ